MPMDRLSFSSSYFFFTAPATTEIYTLSLHDALPIFLRRPAGVVHDLRAVEDPLKEGRERRRARRARLARSEEHTSELQSHHDLVCRLLLEKKNKRKEM